ncbi:MAG: methyltransferase [Thermoplasmatales archaeon SG8-52-3]|jgi:O-methyltransferase|nr:MAG: methyltransferase [Thermoplasmatales archaeon SG8-52-3]
MRKITFLKFSADFINKILNPLGYNATFFQNTTDSNYEKITPIANYAPWKNDIKFNEIYGKIINYSFVDKYRLYELWQLVGETTKIPGALIEIGVWRGGSGALIRKKADLCGISDKLYLCDTFEGIVKTDLEKDPYFKNGSLNNTSEKIVNDLINKKLKLKNVEILKGIFPDETKQFVKDDKFRFCHIDVDVYNSARDIVDWIWKRMSKGGIIVYDDYGFEGCIGITKFVNEERKKSDRIVIHNLNGHAVVIKIV